MFKRPRGNKDCREGIGPERMNKRLKEDSDVQTRSTTQEEDYVNLTYPHKNAGSTGLPGPDLPQYQQTVLSQLSEGAVSMHEDRTEPERHNRYNRLKLQHKNGNSRYEIKVVQYGASQCDSDNSSIASGFTDVHNEPDSKEREHYNKLKVNIHKIQTNKKLLRGVKSLHAECDEQLPFNGIIASSALLQNRKKSAKVAGVNNGQCLADLDNHIPMKYKKEGHTNQLHSVLKPRAFLQKPMPLQSSIHKSRSTGDILHMSQNKTDGVRVNHTTTYRLPYSKSFNNMEIATKIDSGGRDLALHSTHRSPLKSIQVSPMAHIEDSYGCSSNDLSFINKIITFPCTHEGKDINSAAYDFSISIPKGTIKKKKSLDFQVGVCLHGPFVFPRGYKLVSPIVMVTSTAHTKLKKPVEVVISHCMDLTPLNNRNIIFFRAKKMESKNSSHGTHPSNRYYFQPTEEDTNHFEVHKDHGKLKSMELGFFCVMAKDTMETRKHTNYCLVPVVPKCVESSSWKVHYCVTHLQQAFMMVCKCNGGILIKKYKTVTLASH